jgi:hypothetical protein
MMISFFPVGAGSAIVVLDLVAIVFLLIFLAAYQTDASSIMIL